jgi:hypothetical protein
MLFLKKNKIYKENLKTLFSVLLTTVGAGSVIFGDVGTH